MKHLSAAKIAFLVLIVIPAIYVFILMPLQGIDLSRPVNEYVDGWGAVFIIGSLLFLFWLFIWWGTRPDYKPYIRRYEELERQWTLVNTEMDRTELLLDIAYASNSPARDDLVNRSRELFDTAEAILKEQEIVARELPRGYLEQERYHEQTSLTSTEIQEEEDAILATQMMMTLGGMMSSDQPNPFHRG